MIVAQSRPMVLAVLVGTAAFNGFAAPVLVDSFMGGSFWGNSPFRGQLGVTPQWHELGGSFIPDQNSRLLALDVSIFAQDGTTGSAVMTIFRYDQNPGGSLLLGPDLGAAAVPLGSYGDLVAFDFSTQNIQLTAGQTYLYVLSNPGATVFDGFDYSWRADEYQNWSGLLVNGWDQFASSGYNYYTGNTGYGPNYQVFAEVPEPGSLLLVVAFLGVFYLRRAHAARPNQRSGGDGGITVLFDSGRLSPAAPHHGRSP